MKISKLWYLAAPYSGTPEEIALRVKTVMRYDAFLMEQGIFTVSPLNKHLLFVNGIKLPGNWAYWGDYSCVLLERSDGLFVLCLPGWRESEGVQAEIKIAEDLGIPVFYTAESEAGKFVSYHDLAALEGSLDRLL